MNPKGIKSFVYFFQNYLEEKILFSNFETLKTSNWLECCLIKCNLLKVNAMKYGKFLMAFIIAASFVSMSCDIYDDGIPPKAVRAEFKAMYSGVRDVEWEREGQNWFVSYEIGHIECESLYAPDGTWLMSEQDMAYADVPQRIKDYLAASQYGSLRLDDNTVEYYKMPDGNFYRFELEDNGRDIEVDVTANGVVSIARRDLF
jgi:hypothetical protein